MNEEVAKTVYEGLTPQAQDIIEEAFNDEDSLDAIGFLVLLLELPEEDFAILRPLIQEEIINTYADPQIQMQLVQACAQSGISVSDLLEHSDEFAAVFTENVEDLSESKRDFLNTIFAAIANTISTSTINPAHIVEIPIEVCRENIKLPTYATNGSAAMDLYAPEEYNLAPGECVVVPLGFKVAIPHGYALLIQPRSGLSARTKLRVPNSPGLIDEDYHEEVGVIVENIDPPLKSIGTLITDDGPQDGSLYGSTLTIGKGERFAQMRLVEVPRIKWREVSSLGVFEENHGEGYGSTGSE